MMRLSAEGEREAGWMDAGLCTDITHMLTNTNQNIKMLNLNISACVSPQASALLSIRS